MQSSGQLTESVDVKIMTTLRLILALAFAAARILRMLHLMVTAYANALIPKHF
jgi:hypothetical protein